MVYRTFTIETGFMDGEYYYRIRGYGSKRKPDNPRISRRAMTGYVSGDEALQKAKNVIDLKINEGSWKEHETTMGKTDEGDEMVFNSLCYRRT